MAAALTAYRSGLSDYFESLLQAAESQALPTHPKILNGTVTRSEP